MPRRDQLDDQLLRALGQELLRMTGRRSTVVPGALLENSAFRILWVLDESGPRTLLELSEDLQLERSTINRQVNAALRHGHVERYVAPGRSARLVRPTAEGQEAYRHDGRLRGALYTRALNELGADRAAEMLASLRAFNDALDRADDPDAPVVQD